MRRNLSILGIVVLAGSVALSGCSDNASSSAQNSAAATASATAAATTSVANDVDCSKLTIDSDSDALPKISGETPTVSWSGAAAPENLVAKVLNAGDGEKISESSKIVVNYIGWQWGSDNAFDSSWASGNVVSFGLDQVISGWRCGLAGAHVGDRIELSIPAQYAYGTDESSGRPTGTLVFVVDIEKSITADSIVSGTADAKPTDKVASLTKRGITVAGDLGAAASLKVSANAKKPTEIETYVIAKGTGAPLTANSTVVANIASTTWDNQTTNSTWETGDFQTIAMSSMPTDSLTGVPTGSRVVLLFPADESNGTDAMAYVLDLEESF